MNHFLKEICLILRCFIVLFLWLPLWVYGNDLPKVILIHLDAVSSDYFMQELEKGNLPNIQNYFGEYGRINHTITYFPSKTPTVISSIRKGDTPREAAIPGWKYTYDERDSKVGMVGSFLRMAFTKSRLARTNLLYGLPAFNWMAGPALVNTAFYLNDYHIIQYYWYNIDTHGHFYGEKAYLKKFAAFDKWFGRFIKRIDNDVNVIIYSDHGMTFGTGIEIDDAIEKLIGEQLLLYSYPTMYIRNPSQKDEIARLILKETEIDFTFFETGETVVKGYHDKDEIYFIKNPENLTLQYRFEGNDVFGYYDSGYSGEWLTRDEWLELTHQSNYPMVPVSIYYHLKNQISGDILTLFKEDKFHKTGYSSKGNHGGFTSADMTVPLLLKGPRVTSLYNRDFYWLPYLFNDIEGVDFNRRPPRERSFVAARYDFRNKRSVTDISVSPRYRIGYGASFYNSEFNQFSEFDRIDFWGRADLFRSYLSRFWIGTGFEVSQNEANPLLMLQYDIHIRKLVLKNSFATNRPFYFRVSYEVKPWFAIEAVNFTSLGIKFEF